MGTLNPKLENKMPKAPTTKKAVSATAAVKKVPAVKKADAEKAPAAKKTAVKTAARKAAAAAGPVTTVIAKIDAGFGNQLFIRGSGYGLSWESGVLMTNTGPSEWIWKSDAVTGELEFKVLLNDQQWASGPNGVAFPGATVVLEPSF